MNVLYFLPGHIAPLPFWVAADISQAFAKQLGLLAEDVRQETPSGGDTSDYFIYSIYGTAEDGLPNPAANEEAHRLNGEASNYTGPVLFVYQEGRYPAHPVKPRFSLTTQLERDYFALWAKLIAGSLAVDAPYKDADHYWEFLLEGGDIIEEEESATSHNEPEESIVVLLGNTEDFRKPFCKAAQPAIDYVFKQGLRAPDAELAYDADDSDDDADDSDDDDNDSDFNATRNEEEIKQALAHLRQARINLNSIAKSKLTPTEVNMLWDFSRQSEDLKEQVTQFVY